MLMAFAAMIGWCGTKWPGWWRGPHPHPDPEPWWDLAYGILGAIGGVVAVNVFAMGSGVTTAGYTGIVVAAFFGGTFAATAVAALVGMGRKAR